jgi:hypothetical protein
MEVPLDRLLREFLSYQLYMRKKEPLEGFDPGKRVRGGIWKEEGVDIDVLERKGGLPKGFDIPSALFDVERSKVRSGLLWFRSEHRVLKGLRPLSELMVRAQKEALSASGGPSMEMGAVMRSNLLFPLFLHLVASSDVGTAGKLIPGRVPQTHPGDISPEEGLRRFIGTSNDAVPEDEAMEALFTPLKGSLGPLMAGRTDHRNLASLLFSMFELDDQPLSAAIASGELQRLCRDILHNPYLEGLIEDLAFGPDGAQETPDGFRTRAGRVIMGGGAGDRFHQRFVQPLLVRMRTCSVSESERLGSILPPLMDSRSTASLLDLLFKAPQGNRPALFRLIGATNDPSAAEPLRKMMDYSNVEGDRRYAQEALDTIGAERSKGPPSRKRDIIGTIDRMDMEE